MFHVCRMKTFWKGFSANQKEYTCIQSKQSREIDSLSNFDELPIDFSSDSAHFARSTAVRVVRITNGRDLEQVYWQLDSAIYDENKLLTKFTECRIARLKRQSSANLYLLPFTRNLNDSSYLK